MGKRVTCVTPVTRWQMLPKSPSARSQPPSLPRAPTGSVMTTSWKHRYRLPPSAARTHTQRCSTVQHRIRGALNAAGFESASRISPPTRSKRRERHSGASHPARSPLLSSREVSADRVHSRMRLDRSALVVFGPIPINDLIVSHFTIQFQSSWLIQHDKDITTHWVHGIFLPRPVSRHKNWDTDRVSTIATNIGLKIRALHLGNCGVCSRARCSCITVVGYFCITVTLSSGITAFGSLHSTGR